MSVIKSEIRPGAYYDSVILMQLQQALADLPGVQDAGVVMATPANCEILAGSGLGVDTAAGSDDLLIVIKAGDDKSAEEALGQVNELLQRRRKGSSSQDYRPKSLSAALKQLPIAQWVSISVPGRYAADVAREALNLDRHIFLFSDNVSIEDELALKKLALQKGRLLMGPDCGTALINGVGFGFVNRVRRGSIGLIAASGTGLQAISSEIHNMGAGISQAIGTGGRDLKSAIGGITSNQALALLAQDDATDVIIIVSKPPETEVAARLLNRARRIRKPVVVHFIGQPLPARRIDNLYFAVSLNDAADIAVSLIFKNTRGESALFQDEVPSLPNRGFVRGLFSGGTLAYEVVLALQSFLAPIFSNASVFDHQKLVSLSRSQGHTILDLGEDEFTQGRLHPMMDNSLRLRRLQQEAEDPETGIIILDLVLGEAAHPDPASEIGPGISQALSIAINNGRSLEIFVIVVGTNEDPQDFGRQVEMLREAGASVVFKIEDLIGQVTNRLAEKVSDLEGQIDQKTITGDFGVINVGLEIFFDSLRDQGAETVQVDWRPPAGGNEKLMSLLSKMR